MAIDVPMDRVGDTAAPGVDVDPVGNCYNRGEKGERPMETRQKSTYTLAEFRELRRRLTTEPLSEEEAERRRTLGERSDRILAGQNPLPVPVEELIDQAQRFGA